MMKTTQWVSTKLGEVLTLQRGYDLPERDRREGSIPIVTSSGITGYHDEAKAKGPGVVTGRYGTLRQVFFIKEDFWPHNTTLFVRDFKGNEPLFIKYFLSTLQLEVRSAAAAVPGLNRNALHLLPVRVPPLPTQHKIATILSTYDDLIENNTRRIKILEEMAQMLYREWFVSFRFPGHEKAKMVNSRLGKVPEGWEIKKFGDIALNFDSKRIPLSSMKRAEIKGEYPYYGAAKVLDYIDDYIFDGKYLLVAEDGSVITEDGKPVLQMAYGKFWVNNHTHVVQGKSPISTEFLYLMLSHYDISGHVTGAAQPKITQENLNRIPSIIPTDSVLEQFNRIAENLLSTVEALARKNANLRRTRDLLLPKLISGEVDVEDLEIRTL